MKKALALFLALVMCLSLCACGNSEPTPPEVPEGLEFCVGHIWDDSYYYLILYPEGDAKYGEYATVIAPYYWRNLELVEEKDGIVCAQVEIYPEGKDGKTFTVTFYSDPTGHNWAEIDGQILYTTDDSNMTGNEPVGGETASPETTIPETTTPKPVYETIEITMDNWQEYFEFKTEESWEEDAFGDAKRYWCCIYFSLRDEYQDKVASMDVALKCSYTVDHRYYDIDVKNRVFTLGEVYQSNEKEYTPDTISATPYCVWDESYSDVPGMFVIDSNIPILKWVDTMDVVRIQGSIEIQTN